jgi:hypothetical protein
MKKITITPHEWMQIKTFSSPEGEGGTLEALNALLDKKYNHNRVPPIYSKIAGEPHPTQEMEDSLDHYHQNVGHSHRIPQ